MEEAINFLYVIVLNLEKGKAYPGEGVGWYRSCFPLSDGRF